VTVAAAGDVPAQILAAGDPLGGAWHLEDRWRCGARECQEQIGQSAGRHEDDDGQQIEEEASDATEHGAILYEAASAPASYRSQMWGLEAMPEDV
jgi:hypothetical protein